MLTMGQMTTCNVKADRMIAQVHCFGLILIGPGEHSGDLIAKKPYMSLSSW